MQRLRSLRVLFLGLLGVLSTVECTVQDTEQVCEVTAEGEEVCHSRAATDDDVVVECQDEHVRCGEWKSRGECRANPRYMLNHCKKSCNVCGKDALSRMLEEDLLQDFGVPQTIDRDKHEQVRAVIQQTREYMTTVQLPHTLLGMCQNKHENCAFWALLGECTNNEKYMKLSCAPVCQSCEMLQIETRCPLDPNAVDAWYPGDLNKMFERILQEYPQYNVTVLSRPGGGGGTSPEPLDGPWVITLDDFVTQQEADRLIELGAAIGYERSTDVGKMNPDGTSERNVNPGRTSTNAWCTDECMEDASTQAILKRIENLTHIPDMNSENLQLLRYEPGQFYQAHHDYIPHHIKRQQGVRILTVYLYLNEVEEGGGTNFPLLNNITVYPKRGRVLVWPSVRDDDPNREDSRTKHQALPVVQGIKYGANAWVHQRDFKTPNKSGCQ